jgi:hypothetical protein
MARFDAIAVISLAGASPAAAALIRVGTQIEEPVSTIIDPLGWSTCWTATYAGDANFASVLTACRGSDLNSAGHQLAKATLAAAPGSDWYSATADHLPIPMRIGI